MSDKLNKFMKGFKKLRVESEEKNKHEANKPKAQQLKHTAAHVKPMGFVKSDETIVRATTKLRKKNELPEYKNKLKGGKADKKNPKDFDKQALSAGMKVEKEHTKDPSLAMEIAMDHLTEDPKYYEKLKQIEKSENSTIDFKNSKVMIDAKLQQVAEETAPQELINYIRLCSMEDINKIPFAKGTLTLSKKEEGLYSGFFQDNDGQVIHEFENMTPEIVAKNMQMKGLYQSLVPDTSAQLSQPEVEPEQADAAEDREIAKEEEKAMKIVAAAHDRIDMVHQRIDSLEQGRKAKYIKIRYGDFELEIKKSLQQFINTFKKSLVQDPQKSDIIKSIKTWRRNSKLKFDSDMEAAKYLSSNWDSLSEEFLQTLHAERQKNNEG
jgi:hypothetical protein